MDLAKEFDLKVSNTFALTQHTIKPISSLFRQVSGQVGNDPVVPEAERTFGGLNM